MFCSALNYSLHSCLFTNTGPDVQRSEHHLLACHTYEAYQEIDFLISKNRFLDIKKCILRRRFTIFKVFLDIYNLISWYQEFISWYQEIYSWYQEIVKSNSGYQEFHFLIPRNQFLDIEKYLINSKTAHQNTIFDIKKWISWYQEIHFLISSYSFLDFKK